MSDVHCTQSSLSHNSRIPTSCLLAITFWYIDPPYFIPYLPPGKFPFPTTINKPDELNKVHLASNDTNMTQTTVLYETCNNYSNIEVPLMNRQEFYCRLLMSDNKRLNNICCSNTIPESIAQLLVRFPFPGIRCSVTDGNQFFWISIFW